jgi:hypothetical protein
MTILQAWRSRTREHINSFAILLNTLNKWLDVFYVLSRATASMIFICLPHVRQELVGGMGCPEAGGFLCTQRGEE